MSQVGETISISPGTWSTPEKIVSYTLCVQMIVKDAVTRPATWGDFWERLRARPYWETRRYWFSAAHLRRLRNDPVIVEDVVMGHKVLATSATGKFELSTIPGLSVGMSVYTTTVNGAAQGAKP